MDPKALPVMRRAFVPIYRWDRITGQVFFGNPPYCDGDLERWSDDGGPVVEKEFD